MTVFFYIFTQTPSTRHSDTSCSSLHRSLKLYSRPLLYPLRIVVLDLLHLAYRVGKLDDLFRGVAAREDDVDGGGLVLEHGDDAFDGDKAEVHCHVDLVEDDHVVLLGEDGVSRQVEPLPGKLHVDGRGVAPHDEAVEAAEAHREVGKALLGAEDLAVLAALHELDDENFLAVAEGPQGLSEGRRRSCPCRRP